MSKTPEQLRAEAQAGFDHANQLEALCELMARAEQSLNRKVNVGEAVEWALAGHGGPANQEKAKQLTTAK